MQTVDHLAPLLVIPVLPSICSVLCAQVHGFVRYSVKLGETVMKSQKCKDSVMITQKQTRRARKPQSERERERGRERERETETETETETKTETKTETETETDIFRQALSTGDKEPNLVWEREQKMECH